MKLRIVLLSAALALAAVLPRASFAFDHAAMLIVIDRSLSMADGGKFATAAAGIVQALDDDAFDAIDVGLYAAPRLGTLSGPSCVFNLPLDCAAATSPQVPLALAGSLKSTDSTGVRRQIHDWFTSNGPATGFGDTFPLYLAAQSSIAVLQGATYDGPRVIVIVTDGAPCCGQLGGRPGFPDCNGCDHEWEHPDNLVSLLAGAYASPTEPVRTFVIGVPGADSFDPTGCNNPPYHMRLALSAMAHAGAPAFEPVGCTGTTFTQAGGDPTVPCHIDLTTGFNANTLATAIGSVRATALPEPGSGASLIAGIGALVWIERRRSAKR